MQLDLDQIREKRTNLNAQEIGDDQERAKQWQRYQNNPVFSQTEVNKIVAHGVTRLTNMQNPDGGWGWFSGGRGYSYSHTTAVVIHGLQVRLVMCTRASEDPSEDGAVDSRPEESVPRRNQLGELRS